MNEHQCVDRSSGSTIEIMKSALERDRLTRCYTITKHDHQAISLKTLGVRISVIDSPAIVESPELCLRSLESAKVYLAVPRMGPYGIA